MSEEFPFGAVISFVIKGIPLIWGLFEMKFSFLISRQALGFEMRITGYLEKPLYWVVKEIQWKKSSSTQKRIIFFWILLLQKHFYFSQKDFNFVPCIYPFATKRKSSSFKTICSKIFSSWRRKLVSIYYVVIIILKDIRSFTIMSLYYPFIRLIILLPE